MAVHPFCSAIELHLQGENIRIEHHLIIVITSLLKQINLNFILSVILEEAQERHTVDPR